MGKNDAEVCLRPISTMRTIEDTLAMWVSSVLTSDEVILWASNEIARLENPPMELFDLVSDGPEQCLKRSSSDFSPRPVRLSFAQAFSVRAISLDLNSEHSVLVFADWASRQCMGEDLSDPIVSFSYHLDHLISDCDDKAAAVKLVHDKLPSLLTQCLEIARPYLDEVH